MIFYEVTIEVEREIAADYLHWLKVHMVQMLALPGFVDARRFVRSDAPDADRVSYVIRYRLRDQAALDTYFAEHAEAMRADGLRAFGTRFSATRRVLRELD